MKRAICLGIAIALAGCTAVAGGEEKTSAAPEPMPAAEIRADLYFEENPPSAELADRLERLSQAQHEWRAVRHHDPAARDAIRDRSRELRALADETLSRMTPAERAAMRRRGLRVLELASLFAGGGAS
jgi:hypothetical protein